MTSDGARPQPLLARLAEKIPEPSVDPQTLTTEEQSRRAVMKRDTLYTLVARETTDDN
jgi:hypothetical protein